MTLPAARIGQGFDIHRLVAGSPLILGGVPIDSPVGSLAHSDGDALLHALIDALLGATGQGDIGDHFPPSDDRYRNANSAELLQMAWQPLVAEGWRVVNVDATVFLEAPNLGPYKLAIRQLLANLLNVDLAHVSLKAKTAEGFAPVGTQDAVATSVVVLLAQGFNQ
jgi:2-C-methyl-D-erythritol 2,4-cyclodiphosphate synthase